jgi:peroxiredoxin Q/BCP
MTFFLGGGMALQVGDQAPLFTLNDDNNQLVSLQDFRGRSVVIYFYPKDETPGCTREACDFRDSIEQFQKKNAVVLGISKDSVKSHQKFKNNHQLPFTLLADESTAVCKKYQVWMQKQMMGKKYMGIDRTTFVIDKNGIITHIWHGVKVEGHVADVLKQI